MTAFGGGGQDDRDVVEHLGQDPAQPDQHHGAEHRVPAAADDQLHAGRRHRLHQVAAETGTGAGGGIGELGDAGPQGSLVRQPEQHAPSLGLMGQAFRLELERNGSAAQLVPRARDRVVPAAALASRTATR